MESQKNTNISLSAKCRWREYHKFTALLPAHSVADVVVTYMPDAQRELQDAVSAGCPQLIELHVWSDGGSEVV